MNIYTFSGRLGKDCEIRFTQGGMGICSFSVAVDYGFGDNKGTNWIRCSVFGKRAEGKLPEYLLKGTQVGISGELRVRDFTDNDGNKRTSVECNVNTLDLLGSKNDDTNRRGSNNSGVPNQGGAQQRKPQDNTKPITPADPFDPQPGFDNYPVDDDIPF